MNNALKRILFFILAGCVSTAFLACNSSADVHPKDMDSTITVPDSATVIPDTGKHLVDTSHHTISDGSKPGKSAILGYSYFPIIKRNETKDINVYVSIIHPESEVRSTLKLIVNEQTQHPITKEDTSAIYTINVIVYKSLDISLVDPAGDFTITRIHPADKQQIDTINGNRWHWTINTKTDKKETKLILKVVAQKPEGVTEQFEDKTIVLNVQIDPNIVRTFFNYLTDNPKVTIPILVSLIGFIGVYLRYRWGKKKES